MIATRVLLPTLLVWPLLSGCHTTDHGTDVRERPPAIANLIAIGSSGVDGWVRFEPAPTGVRVRGRVTGLEPGPHGFHVHQYGDLSDRSAGQSAGGHFDPRGMPHGRPGDHDRHVGDLGNIVANAQGVATFDFVDRVIALHGPYSVLGRSVVVHAGQDVFTQPSGDAGGRVAVGIVGIANPEQRQNGGQPAGSGQKD